MAKRVRRGTAFTLLAVGILLIVVFGKPLGLFSVVDGESQLYAFCNTPAGNSNSILDGDISTFSCACVQNYIGSATITYTDVSPGAMLKDFSLWYKDRGFYDTDEVRVVCDVNGVEQLLFEDEDVQTEMVTITIPDECIANNQLVIKNYFDRTCGSHYEFDYEECVVGETKCEGTDSFICGEGRWNNAGKLIGECGVECIQPDDKCVGTEFFECVNYNWIGAGQLQGHCGFQDDAFCSAGDETCQGQVHYICLNGGWSEEGVIDGECGYSAGSSCGNGIQDDGEEGIDCGGVCLNLRDCSGDNEVSGDFLNDEIFTVGDFIIKMWMLLLLIGAIVILFIFKK